MRRFGRPGHRFPWWGGGCLALLLFATPARAEPYREWLQVEDEDDLLELQARGTLDEATYETLVALLAAPLELNSASREALYGLPNLTYADVDALLDDRGTHGPWSSLDELVARGVLTRQLRDALLPFVRFDLPDTAGHAVSGLIRYRTLYVPPEDRVPPMALDARVRWKDLQAGVALVLERDALRPVAHDPSRDAWATEGERVRVWPHRYGIEWNTPRWQILAGTFSVGFAQRLTIDTTPRLTPHGLYPEWSVQPGTSLVRRCRASAGEQAESPCAALPRAYGTPEYRASSSLGGIGIALHPYPLRHGAIEAHAWISLQSPPTPSHAIRRLDRCPQFNPADPACKPDPVFEVSPQQPTAPALALTGRRIPWARLDLMGGVNLGYHLGTRSRIGVRGYGATTWWRLPGVRLDFQPSASLPAGGAFGAIGADGIWGRGPVDVMAETSVSITAEGGHPRAGLATIAGIRGAWTHHQVEIWGRYYGPQYQNPYAGPMSAPDRVDGIRARDEVGGRLLYAGDVLPWWSARATLDLYTVPWIPRPRLTLMLRQQFSVRDVMNLGIDLDLHDRDLTTSGRRHCFEGAPRASSDFAAETLPEYDARCRGEALRFGMRIHGVPHPRVILVAAYHHRLMDADDLDGSPTGVSPYRSRFRHDGSAAFELRVQPIDNLRLRLRARWHKEKLRTLAYGEHTTAAGLQLDLRPTPPLLLAVGYLVRFWLDRRASTLVRVPNPEHWLNLRLEVRF